MTDEDWADPTPAASRSTSTARDDPDHDEDGNPLIDDDFLLARQRMVGAPRVHDPHHSPDARWTVALDSARDELVGEQLSPEGPSPWRDDRWWC